MWIFPLLYLLVVPTVLAADLSPEESKQINEYHNYWRGKYLKESSRVEGGLFVDYEGKGTTCSEAQGYGMLIAVYLSQVKDTRAKQEFESLNRFQQAFRSNIDSRLMAWRVDDTQKTPVETACATDGDMDIAYALLLAAEKWDEAKYRDQAKSVIAGIEKSLIREDFSLRRGDWDTKQNSVRLSDIMPTHFRKFAEVSNTTLWTRVAQVHFKILHSTVSDQGVFPDFVVKTDGMWKPAPPKYLESEHDGAMYYNSCRVPWRLSHAALVDGDKNSKELLAIFNRGVGKVLNQDFMAGYKLSGVPLNDWTDGAFTAPHMCSLIVANRSKDYKQAVEYQLGKRESYFQDTIRLLSLYLCFANSP
jgi:endoglucanase